MNVSTGQRLTLVAVLAVLVLLPITGGMIARAYQRSALQGFDHRVAAYAQTMAGRLDVVAQGVLRGARSPRVVCTVTDAPVDGRARAGGRPGAGAPV